MIGLASESLRHIHPTRKATNHLSILFSFRFWFHILGLAFLGTGLTFFPRTVAVSHLLTDEARCFVDGRLDLLRLLSSWGEVRRRTLWGAVIAILSHLLLLEVNELVNQWMMEQQSSASQELYFKSKRLTVHQPFSVVPLNAVVEDAYATINNGFFSFSLLLTVVHSFLLLKRTVVVTSRLPYLRLTTLPFQCNSHK